MPYYPATIEVYRRELLRPWKLVTFLTGLALLIFGAYWFRVVDWDVSISVIMASCAYLFAPWCAGILVYIYRERPGDWYRHILKCIVVSYFSVSVTWELYNIPRIGVEATYYIYPGNLKTSGLIFFGLGFFWQFEGSLRELWIQIKRAIKT